jgi:uncharacterized membrane protein
MMPPAMDDTFPAATAASPELRAIRALAVGSLLALIALLVAWDLWFAHTPSSAAWIVLKVLPLSLAVSGLLRHRMYTYRWMSLLVWLYFTEGVVRAWSDRGASQWLAALEIVLCLLLFTACGLHVRQRLGWGRKKR